MCLKPNIDEPTMKVIGYVVRRRCLGKWLAFADIATIDDSDSENQEKESVNNSDDVERQSGSSIENDPNNDGVSSSSSSILRVMFQRQSPSWNKEYDNTFPNKTTKLPYGCKIELENFEPVSGMTGTT